MGSLLRIQRDLALRLDAADSIEAGLRLCLEAALAASGMDAGGVYLCDEKTGALDIVVHQGLSAEFISDVGHMAADSSQVKLVMTGKPIYTRHRRLIEGIPLDNVRHREGLLALGVIPLLRGDHVIGCLNIGSRRIEEVPAAARDALETIVAQMGNAIGRLKVEMSLRESEARFRTMMETMDDLVYICSGQYRVEYMNAALIRRSGYDGTGELCYEVLHNRTSPCPWCVNERVFAGEHVKWEVSSPKDHRTFSVSNTPFRHVDGTISKMAVIRDITDLKRNEDERQKMERQMLYAQKLESLGVLASGIAHDFNNLLGAVLGNIDIAAADVPEDSPVRGSLKAAVLASQRAADLCRQLLAYSGKGAFLVETVDIGELVREITEMLKVSVSRKAQIRYELAPEPLLIDADATQVRQIVMNLVVNASDALGSESGRITVRTGLKTCDAAFLTSVIAPERPAAGVYVYLEVADTGCGMTPEEMGKIFDPFFSTKAKGRGLGLAAVLGIVRAHRGGVTLESRPGKGTTFRVLFPLSKENIARDVEEDGDAVKVWRGTGTVLVVDDEPMVVEVAWNMLTRLGFKVVAAANGREALEIFEAQKDVIVCVILDVTMPELNGMETFDALRRMRKDLPIILSTGYSTDVIQDLADKNVSGFIQKPYPMSALIRTLKRVLKSAPKPGGADQPSA